MQSVTCAIEMLNELDDSPLILEIATLIIAFIMKLDVHATVEERKFLETLIEGIKVVFCDAEDLIISLEGRFWYPFFSLLDLWSPDRSEPHVRTPVSK